MVISKDELKRIAGICLLDFSDEEYESLKQSLETTIAEAQLLFRSADFDESSCCDCLLDEEILIDIAKKSFSFCIQKENNEK